MLTVIAEGDEVKKAVVGGVGTVTATATVAPALSRTTMLALPADTPVIFRLLPDKVAVATLVLLLVAVYGAVPPPTLYAGLAPTGTVTLAGAVLNKFTVAAVGTVTVMFTTAPTLSMIIMLVVPAVTPVIFN